MYWPLGAPKVFEHALPKQLFSASNDGLAVKTSNVRGARGFSRQNSASTSKARPNGQENEDASTGTWSLATDEQATAPVIGMKLSRNGQLFATITQSVITLWQSKPTVILASVIRSAHSLDTYGPNVALIFRPDAAILVVQTSLGYLITYTLVTEGQIQNYKLAFLDQARRHARRRNSNTSKSYGVKEKGSLMEGGGTITEVGLRFRMVIKLDAGISKALALEDELIVATEKPAAIQCIRWVPDRSGSQTSTEMMSHMQWLQSDGGLEDMVYDRPMSLFAWILTSGQAYAVQRLTGGHRDPKNPKTLFNGHEFHSATSPDQYAKKAAINSKFSVIAIGCADASINIYLVRDYSGGITLLRRLSLPVSLTTSGGITTLCYSPDGHCLFVGYEHGWATWSVYGLQGASSFNSDTSLPLQVDDRWLAGVSECFWVGMGSDIMLLSGASNQLFLLEFARSAIAGCYTPANISNALLQTSSGFMIYQGHNMPDLTTISADVTLWQHVQAPVQYLVDQWPIRAAVISPDGRYLAIAGQRGLAHYSVSSGRWKTFENEAMQNEFSLRGGMCWHQHVLIAAVELPSSHEIRLYSRELALDNTKVLHTTKLTAPAVYIAPSGDDSLLVYTYENVLDHYVIVAAQKTVHLSKVGQIALHGIIRAPARVRAISWIIPDHQLENGDPSQDVSVASIIFLVDGKMVLLQPSTTDEGELKYDMRAIAHNVEYYSLARDNPLLYASLIDDLQASRTLQPVDMDKGGEAEHSLHDSLWVFNGHEAHVWTDVQELLSPVAGEYNVVVPASIAIPVDFYPLTGLLQKGVLFGLEAELAQHRDASFALFRTLPRTTLFLPNILRHQLSRYDSPAALHLSHRYQHLPYFAHALEMLLHNVLDEEVESAPGADGSLLASVLSFLSTFPQYLDIVVQCTRKTELRSWRTLFAHLPPALELFERSLSSGALKTAGGYLLVLHTLAEIDSTSPQVIRLLRAAKAQRDWELCKELARFLMALDETGATLRQALELVDAEDKDDIDVDVDAVEDAVENAVADVEDGVAGRQHRRVRVERRRSGAAQRLNGTPASNNAEDIHDVHVHVHVRS